MSVFDPEKVKRGHIDLTGDEFVLAKDFDKLLALCRLQREIIEKVAAPAVQREYDWLPEDVKAISDALYKQYVESLEGIKL
jgi:hypothetical protein